MDNTNNKIRYVVYSRGVTLPSFDKEELIIKLSALFNKPKVKVTSALLNGHLTKIKSFDDIESANKLIKELSKLGLSCCTATISNDGEHTLDKVDKPAKGAVTGSSEMPKKGTTVKKSWFKWVLVLVLLLAFIPAAYFLFSKPLVSDLPVLVNKVETALFSSQKPSVIVFVDIKKSRHFVDLIDSDELAEKSKLMLSQVQVPLLNPEGGAEAVSRATDFVISSASLDGGDSDEESYNHWLTVLQGDYAEVNLESELSKIYVIEKDDKGVFTLIPKPVSLTGSNDNECPKEEEAEVKSKSPTYAYLKQDHIALSPSKQRLSLFESAYSQNVEVRTHQLEEWQNYRGSSLAAISLFDERLLQKNFIANGASKALLADNKFKSLGVRTSVSLLKQALELSFDADMADALIAKELASKIEMGIGELSASNKDAFPSAIDLLSRIDVTSDHALHLNVSLDKQVTSEMEGLVSDFFSMMFNTNVNQGQADDVPTEELENNLWDYALNKKVLLKTEPPISNFDKFHPLVINNSVAVFMGELGVKHVSPFDEKLGSAFQLTLKAKRVADFGDAFFGWSNSGIKQSLAITSVTDSAGNSLMVDERCLKKNFSQKLNHEPNDATNYVNGVIDTPKTVRLLDSVSVHDINSIKGQYQLIVPIDVGLNNVSLDKPLMKWDGGTFKLTRINNGTIDYELVDANDHLLEIRGLNKKGQVLSYSSEYSTGKKYTKKFKGEVASVDLVIAGDFEQQKFDFNIDNVIPKRVINKNNNVTPSLISEPVLFEKVDVEKFSKSVALDKLNAKEKKQIFDQINWKNYSLDSSKDNELGHVLTSSSVVFLKHDPNSQWRHELEGLVLLPFDDALLFTDGLVSVELELDGESVEPVDLSFSRSVSISQANVSSQKVSSLSIASRDYAIGTFSIPFKEKRAEIKGITGVLQYTLPTRIKHETINLLNPKSAVNGLTFIAYDFSWQGSVTYQLDESLAKAYFIKITNEEGVQSVGKVSSNDEVTEVEFDLVEGLSKIDFYFIEEAHSITDEFKFTPSYK